MKQMEYTVKVITNGPVNPDQIAKAITDNTDAASATVTNFRVVPKPKAPAVASATQS